MKKKIYFAAKWNKEDITKTWSGTSYSLYVALSKIYDVTKIDIPRDWFTSWCKRMRTITQCAFFMYINDMYIKWKVNKQIKDFTIPIFTIGAFDYDNPTYIYVDDIIATQYRIRKTVEEGWGFNSFGYVSDRLLSGLVKRDFGLYNHARKVFFMGHWLKEISDTIYPMIVDHFIAVGGASNAIIRHKESYRNITERRQILFVGRDFKRKGGFLLLKAFCLLRSRIPNVELIIVGPKENPIEGELDGITFLGDVDYDRVGELMYECDLFCMPSKFEAYGLVFIEALMTGLPIVARNAWEMKYFVENGVTGELIDEDSPIVLCEALEKVLLNNKYYENVLSRYKQYQQQYNWDSVAKDISKYIEMNR